MNRESLESQIAELQKQVSDQEIEIARLEQHTDQQATGIHFLQNEMKLRQAELDSIHKSKAWKVVNVYRDLRRKISGKAVSGNIDTAYQDQLRAESKKWGSHLQREAAGERNAWLDHPAISEHYHQLAMVDGMQWQDWIRVRLGRPAAKCLSLGCGSGQQSFKLHAKGSAVELYGIDISEERVAVAEKKRRESNIAGEFRVADINTSVLTEKEYDLIFASHSFHHFVELEYILEQVRRALTPGGLFILEEFVGPTQFQWTDLQMSHTTKRLMEAPERFRVLRWGAIKHSEGRPTPADVVAVSPFESIRSAEITPLFHRFFPNSIVRSLGGTIQHLLYNGIIHNFAEDDPEACEYIRSTYELEDSLIEQGTLPSDFQLLIGNL